MAEFLLEVAIKNRGNYTRLQPVGSCYYCASDVTGNLLFCNLDCSSEYDREQRIRKIAGRA